MARALMMQGTASHVGKSVLTAAFGRWLAEHGLRVAPFKAQNMSLNSFVTLEGAEIARSQAAQAAALGLEPLADMNPILLKPMNSQCQVIVQGKSVGVMTIHEYYAFKSSAWRAVTESYDRLATCFDAIVLEGAGSPAEINLREHDLVNMRMAEHADAKVVVVADIERGGVFAQLVGTWELLRREERARIIGFLINKFRGDATLLRRGLDYLCERTGRPVLGVLPFDDRVMLEEEDSLALDESIPEAATEIDGPAVQVAVVRLPGISNFTDFEALGRQPGVRVRFVSRPEALLHADLIILPGTRTTVRALEWLRQTAFGEALRGLAADGSGPVLLGLCGGFQLLGREIEDLSAVESGVGHAEGLGLLDVRTRFLAAKMLYRVEGEGAQADAPGFGCPLVGYEIHHGESSLGPKVRPWLRLRRQPGDMIVQDGAVSGDGRVLGCYVHGLFDDARFAEAFVNAVRRRRNLPPADARQQQARREAWARRFEHLTKWLRRHCDLKPVALALDLPP